MAASLLAVRVYPTLQDSDGYTKQAGFVKKNFKKLNKANHSSI